MMTLSKRYILIIAFFNLCSIGQAQTTIPFELYDDKYVLIKVPTVKGADSLTFYFDTGATTTLLDAKIAKKCNIKAAYKQNVPGASGNKSYDIATNQKIYLTNNLVLENINIVLEDLTRLSGVVGKKFDGIIGNDVLKNYITNIDFEKRKMHLYPFKEKINTSGFTEIDFSFKNNIQVPQFPITIELFNGEKLSEDILFDSGAGLLLFLNAPFQQKNDIIKKVGKTVISNQNNLSGKASTTLAVIKSLEIGKYKFEGNLPISISSDKAGVSSYPGYLGILGSEIITRFNSIIDYSTQKLYLKPNELFGKEFSLPISPIKLSYIDNKIIISGVIEDSQAYIKGLRENQTVVSINGNATSNIEEYRRILSEEGTDITVKYSDENKKTKICRFKLEKIF